jgi:hypothetical protein
LIDFLILTFIKIIHRNFKSFENFETTMTSTPTQPSTITLVKTTAENVLVHLRGLFNDVMELNINKNQHQQEQQEEINSLQRRLTMLMEQQQQQNTGNNGNNLSSSSNKLISLIEELRVARNNDVKLRELSNVLQRTEFTLETERKEHDRQRERLREAMVTSTRCQLQMQQMSEELVTARDEAVKSERKALKENRDCTLLRDENTALTKRVKMLEMELERYKDGIHDDDYPRHPFIMETNKNVIKSSSNTSNSAATHTKKQQKQQPVITKSSKKSPLISNHSLVYKSSQLSTNNNNNMDGKTNKTNIGLQNVFDEDDEIEDEDSKQFDFL